jgi:hypothetical protein
MSNSNQFSRDTTVVTGWLGCYGLVQKFLCDDCFAKQPARVREDMRRTPRHYTRLVNTALCLSSVRCTVCNKEQGR